MGESTAIGWTDHTFNSHMGCQRVSPACGGAKGVGGCYAEALVTGRMGYNATSADPRRRLTLWGPPSTSTRQRTSAANWRKPLEWDRAAKADGVRRRVFCASLADVFEDHPDLPAVRNDLWPLVERCDGLDWQLLTKRPENIRAMVPRAWLESWPAHVWVGTTVEDQRRAEERIPELLAVPAAVRFLSCEPLLEAVDLSEWIAPMSLCGGCGAEHEGHIPDECPDCETDSLITTWGEAQAERWRTGERYDDDSALGREDVAGTGGLAWVIVGGESGPGARPFDLAWARSIVAQCDAAGVPVFVKQMGDNPWQTADECPTGSSCGLDECAGGCRYEESTTRALRFRAHHGADPAEWPEDLRRQSFPEVRHVG